jgi:hypothetical protein
VVPGPLWAAHVPLAPGDLHQKPDVQSASLAHAVLHATVLAHTKLPGHGAGVGLLPQLPLPLHVGAAVNPAPLHDGEPQVADGDACSHTAPAAQFPSLPHGGATGHCPAGAAVPGVTLAHVPFATPVRACAQAWHVPLHAVAQQKPVAQNPLSHCALEEQGWPVGSVHWPCPSHTLPP